MSRYIDADAFERAVMFSDDKDLQDVIYRLRDYPTADVRENVRGEWIEKDLDNFRKYQVTCSECGAVYIGNYDAYDEPSDFNFCPNCGADMRGEQDG